MLTAPRVALVVATLFLSGCADPSQFKKADPPPGTLNAQQVRALFTEKTVKSVTFNKGEVYRTYYKKNGYFYQERKGKMRRGDWKVKRSGRLCEWFGVQTPKCRAVVRAGENTYVKYVIKRDGNHRPVARYLSFEPGDRLKSTKK